MAPPQCLWLHLERESGGDFSYIHAELFENKGNVLMNLLTEKINYNA